MASELSRVRETFDLTVRDTAETMAEITDYSVNSLRRSVSRIEEGQELLLSNEDEVRQAYSEVISSRLQSAVSE